MDINARITAEFREMKQAQDDYRDLKANDAPQSQINKAFREFKEEQGEYRNWKDPILATQLMFNESEQVDIRPSKELSQSKEKSKYMN
jgi:DnaJ-domain-containing protein 1